MRYWGDWIVLFLFCDILSIKKGCLKGVHMILTIEEITKKVVPIAKKYNLKEVYLFGSYARGKAKEDSDIDLAFSSNETLSYFKIFEIEAELEEAMGKAVDLVPIVQLSEAKTPIGRYMYEKAFQKEKRLIA